MVKVLNYEETRQLIRSIIDNAPDGEDTEATCMYVADEFSVQQQEAEAVGQPVCVVGHLFVEKLGIEPSVFLNGGINGQSVDLMFTESYDRDTTRAAVQEIRGTVRFTPKALRYLDILQNEQDEGRTWGTADEFAARTVNTTLEYLEDQEIL